MFSFLQDHPGGAKAILLYAGREATEGKSSLSHWKLSAGI